MTRSQPTYSLEEIKRLVAVGRWYPTGEAKVGARRLGLGVDDIIDCVLNIPGDCFYKTMPSNQVEGTFQDVYRTHYEEYYLYVKLQIGVRGAAVVISFKEK